MADTNDVAATVRQSARRTAARAEDSLEDQIAHLQEEIKLIGASISKLADQKVTEARRGAKTQYKSLVNTGHHVVDDISDQVSAYEGQLVESIRERPLTAVAGAIGIGFLIALLSRR
jgi:ElaB/YqjD/DUF883 family membrane-anchored ribosome-binding protein